MTEPRDVARQVRQWLEKADHDLRNAEHTLTIFDGCPSIPYASTRSRVSKST